MRFVIAFIVFVIGWQVVAELNAGRGDLGLDLSGLTAWLGSDRVADDAPNWGDVAAKIGELSAERAAMREGLAEHTGPPEPKPQRD